MSQDIKKEESLTGFRKLHELLKVQKEDYAKCGKVFAVRHTEDFIRPRLSSFNKYLSGNSINAVDENNSDGETSSGKCSSLQ